jgi:hypothetical protein
MFIKTLKNISADDYIHKADLLEIFDKPFQKAKYDQKLEREYYEQRKREAEISLGITPNYNPFRDQYEQDHQTRGKTKQDHSARKGKDIPRSQQESILTTGRGVNNFVNKQQTLQSQVSYS